MALNVFLKTLYKLYRYMIPFMPQTHKSVISVIALARTNRAPKRRMEKREPVTTVLVIFCVTLFKQVSLLSFSFFM